MEAKVVITYKDGKAVVGVQSPGSDPYFVMVTGELQQVIEQVPVIVTAAQEKWKTRPKNPTITLPKPAPVKEAVAAASKSGAKPVPAAGKPQPQPSMF